MDDIAIKVDHVSKTFRLPHERQNSIKGTLISMLRGGRRTYEKQRVLKDVSFEIKKGEFFGIVGRNGSGKSTLLKMMAGIYAPSKGAIHINGKLTPFIELGVGFNPELTGRENVFLNGALLGFNRKDMDAMYNDIVGFAELEKFMDQKLKNYSSGMQVRLAFSIAIRARSDILLLDEVLAVGDANFQQKCFSYFQKLKDEKRTVIFVSHDRNAVRTYCSKCLLVEEGKMVAIGEPEIVLRKYEDALLNDAASKPEKDDNKQGDEANVEPAKRVARILNIRCHSPGNGAYFTEGEMIPVEITYEAYQKLNEPILGCIISNRYNASVLVTNSRSKRIATGGINAGEKVILKYEFANNLGNGAYSIRAGIANTEGTIFFDEKTKGNAFRVGGNKDEEAVIIYADKMEIERA